MKLIKKWTAVLTAILVMSGQPSFLSVGIEKNTVKAEENYYENYIFDEEAGTCCINHEVKLRGKISIPDTVEHNGKSYPVVSIHKRSLEYVESLYLGANVENVTGYESCPVLSEIKVSPDNKHFFVKDEVVFQRFIFGSGDEKSFIFFYPKNKMEKKYTIPEEYTLPDLNENKYIETLVIPEGRGEKIKNHLKNCSSLKTIYIPESMLYVDELAFEGCINLTDIYYEGPAAIWNKINFSRTDGITIHTDNEKTYGQIKYTIDDITSTCRVSGYEKNITKSVTIPEHIKVNGKVYKVTSINASAFENCNRLMSINIPDTVTSIGIDSFSGCSNLRSVFSHNSIVSIGISAFENCGNLRWFAFDKKTEIIGADAFKSCEMLRTLDIPVNVEIIGDGAFDKCYSLKSINVDKDNEFYSSEEGVLLNKIKTMIIKYPGAKIEKNYALHENPLEELQKISEKSITDNDKKTDVVSDSTRDEMLKFISQHTAKNSPLTIGYKSAGYDEIFSYDQDIIFLDGGYACILNETRRKTVVKDGIYDEHSIVRQISDMSGKDEIDNYSRLLDYINNEVGEGNYQIYDVYRLISYNTTKSDPAVYKRCKSVKKDCYFVEIIPDNITQTNIDNAYWKDDYVVTYEIKNEVEKEYNEEKEYEKKETKSMVLSEYPYFLECCKAGKIVQKMLNPDDISMTEEGTGSYQVADRPYTCCVRSRKINDWIHQLSDSIIDSSILRSSNKQNRLEE